MRVSDINAALVVVEADESTIKSQQRIKLSAASTQQQRGPEFREAMSKGRRRSGNHTEDEKQRYRAALAHGPMSVPVEKVSKTGVRYCGMTKVSWAPTARLFGFTKRLEAFYLSLYAKGERLEDLE